MNEQLSNPIHSYTASYVIQYFECIHCENGLVKMTKLIWLSHAGAFSFDQYYLVKTTKKLVKILVNLTNKKRCVCVGVMYFGVIYSGEYDVCGVTLSVYPHRTS